MIARMMELNKQLESEHESTSYLKDQLKLSHEKILQLNKEEEDMILVHDQLQQKLEEITQVRSKFVLQQIYIKAGNSTY